MFVVWLLMFRLSTGMAIATTMIVTGMTMAFARSWSEDERK